VVRFHLSSNKGAVVHFSLHHFAAIAAAAGFVMGLSAQELKQPASANLVTGASFALQAPTAAAAQASREEAADNPVADPRAVVAQGKARFTVLTPQLIRIEWAADGKFEDHASFVFINRRLPVPAFSHEFTGGKLTIKTDALTLTYTQGANGRFTADNLSIGLTVDGKPVVWRPGTVDLENLKGTTRTLDGALGDKTKEPVGNGFI
jgi:alpha-glucosidase